MKRSVFHYIAIVAAAVLFLSLVLEGCSRQPAHPEAPETVSTAPEGEKGRGNLSESPKSPESTGGEKSEERQNNPESEPTAWENSTETAVPPPSASPVPTPSPTSAPLTPAPSAVVIEIPLDPEVVNTDPGVEPAADPESTEPPESGDFLGPGGIIETPVIYL